MHSKLSHLDRKAFAHQLVSFLLLLKQQSIHAVDEEA